MVCPPAPAATSRTRPPGPTPAMSSIVSVACPSHSSTVGPQRYQGSAALCHCSLVVSLYLIESNWVGSVVMIHPPFSVSLRAINDTISSVTQDFSTRVVDSIHELPRRGLLGNPEGRKALKEGRGCAPGPPEINT